MLLNTGAKAVQSTHGLLTTVGMQLGSQAETQYALEGSIAIAGASVKWLRDNMGVISSAKELEPLARQVPDCGGVYFVPAFSGLFAPRWREDARGAIVGLTQYTTKHHLARATFEAVCFQTCDVMQAMEADSGVHLQRLRVDGGMTASDLMLQTQADLLGIPIERAIDAEATAFGAAVSAGLAVGFWRDTADVMQRVRGAAEAAHVSVHVFRPAISAESRVERLRMWNKAVQRSLEWVEHKL
jgi:glycerol kinase